MKEQASAGESQTPLTRAELLSDARNSEMERIGQSGVFAGGRPTPMVRRLSAGCRARAPKPVRFTERPDIGPSPTMGNIAFRWTGAMSTEAPSVGAFYSTKMPRGFSDAYATENDARLRSAASEAPGAARSSE